MHSQNPNLNPNTIPNNNLQQPFYPQQPVQPFYHGIPVQAHMSPIQYNPYGNYPQAPEQPPVNRYVENPVIVNNQNEKGINANNTHT